MGAVSSESPEPLPPLPGLWSRLPLWQDFDMHGKRVLMREDFNVPLLDSGAIRDDTRLRASLPGLRQIVAAGASVRVISHLGRPEPGEAREDFSLRPVARWFSEQLGMEVPLLGDGWHKGEAPPPGHVAICENVRFMRGESGNSPEFAKALGAMCDLYVNDAFAVSHREHASVCGVAEHAPQACLGPLMYQEIKHLGCVMESPQRPFVAVVGGAKLESKMGVLLSLLPKVDTLIAGGGIANALLAGMGHELGASLGVAEPSAMRMARDLLSSEHASKLALPEDAVCAASPAADSYSCALDGLGEGHVIFDIGPRSGSKFAGLLRDAGTIIWSGPPGFFEVPAFAAGTKGMVEAIAASAAFSVAGGGDTLAAISAFGGQDGISYLSTGGGAFLSFLESGTLPALEAMRGVGHASGDVAGRKAH